ncbi:YbaB/EbfC family nucleoid-associated protein [Litorivicinus lipolyticus]|jgi:nucleoid-associated protein EbfC|uniref:Nucleoid-associated protein GH975_05265 n=1 Tax=Litorivicinus lipolyticus TaxID=418701 RepID=A0A5Q2QDD9_9GAMM|nr:YbaB/EbfC family nucleoid-associated protein [Litorivicinus lipolyticus]QGG80017.1 YbaB/EbfC family nucleoid-associated protein [Litorivicinus lipolyticus]
MFNMGDLMGQMKDMQSKIQEQQAEMLKLEVLGEAGAGLVSVRLNGGRDVLAVQIDDSLMGDDKGVLQDLLAAAINDANQKLEKLMQSKMMGMMPGMGGMGPGGA